MEAGVKGMQALFVGKSGEHHARGILAEVLHLSEVTGSEEPDIGIDLYARFTDGPTAQIGFQIKRYDSEGGSGGVPLRKVTLLRWLKALDVTPIVVLRVSRYEDRLTFGYCVLYDLLKREPGHAVEWCRPGERWWLPAAAFCNVLKWDASGQEIFVSALRAEAHRVSSATIIPYSSLTPTSVFRRLGSVGRSEVPVLLARHLEANASHSAEVNAVLRDDQAPPGLLLCPYVARYRSNLAQAPDDLEIKREVTLVKNFFAYLRTEEVELIPAYASHNLRVWRPLMNVYPEAARLIAGQSSTVEAMNHRRQLTVLSMLSYMASLEDSVVSGRAYCSLQRISKRINCSGMRTFGQYSFVRQLIMSEVEAGVTGSIDRYLDFLREQRSSGFRWHRKIIAGYYGGADWGQIRKWMGQMVESPTARQERAMGIYQAYLEDLGDS